MDTSFWTRGRLFGLIFPLTSETQTWNRWKKRLERIKPTYSRRLLSLITKEQMEILGIKHEQIHALRVHAYGSERAEEIEREERWNT